MCSAAATPPQQLTNFVCTRWSNNSSQQSHTTAAAQATHFSVGRIILAGYSNNKNTFYERAENYL